MKKGIHPQYYPQARVICSCGNTWITGSTKPVIHTEVCSVCHPFFTGEQRIVDTEGQVERFIQRLERSEDLKAARAGAAPEDEVEEEASAEVAE